MLHKTLKLLSFEQGRWKPAQHAGGLWPQELQPSSALEIVGHAWEKSGQRWSHVVYCDSGKERCVDRLWQIQACWSVKIRPLRKWERVEIPFLESPCVSCYRNRERGKVIYDTRNLQFVKKSVWNVQTILNYPLFTCTYTYKHTQSHFTDMHGLFCRNCKKERCPLEGTIVHLYKSAVLCLDCQFTLVTETFAQTPDIINDLSAFIHRAPPR